MATFAVIESNKVTNIIVADTKEVAETVTGLTCVEYTEEDPVGIGWTYNGSTFDRPLMEEPNE